jgi:hypothetical protein
MQFRFDVYLRADIQTGSRCASSQRRLQIWLVVSVIFIFSASTGVGCSRRAQHMLVPETCTFELPDGAGKLTFWRIGLNALVAEYSQKITLTRSQPPGRPHPLLMDIGSGTYVNVYWIDDQGRQFVRLDDAHGEYLLEVEADILYLIVRAGERAFAGQFDSETATFQSMMADNDPATLKIEIEGKPAVSADTLTDDLHGQYLGAILGPTGRLRFWPASDLPEQVVKKL